MVPAEGEGAAGMWRVSAALRRLSCAVRCLLGCPIPLYSFQHQFTDNILFFFLIARSSRVWCSTRPTPPKRQDGHRLGAPAPLRRQADSTPPAPRRCAALPRWLVAAHRM